MPPKNNLGDWNAVIEKMDPLIEYIKEKYSGKDIYTNLQQEVNSNYNNLFADNEIVDFIKVYKNKIGARNFFLPLPVQQEMNARIAAKIASINRESNIRDNEEKDKNTIKRDVQRATRSVSYSLLTQEEILANVKESLKDYPSLFKNAEYVRNIISNQIRLEKEKRKEEFNEQLAEKANEQKIDITSIVSDKIHSFEDPDIYELTTIDNIVNTTIEATKIDFLKQVVAKTEEIISKMNIFSSTLEEELLNEIKNSSKFDKEKLISYLQSKIKKQILIQIENKFEENYKEIKIDDIIQDKTDEIRRSFAENNRFEVNEDDIKKVLLEQIKLQKETIKKNFLEKIGADKIAEEFAKNKLKDQERHIDKDEYFETSKDQIQSIISKKIKQERAKREEKLKQERAKREEKLKQERAKKEEEFLKKIDSKITKTILGNLKNIKSSNFPKQILDHLHENLNEEQKKYFEKSKSEIEKKISNRIDCLKNLKEDNLNLNIDTAAVNSITGSDSKLVRQKIIDLYVEEFYKNFSPDLDFKTLQSFPLSFNYFNNCNKVVSDAIKKDIESGRIKNWRCFAPDRVNDQMKAARNIENSSIFLEIRNQIKKHVSFNELKKKMMECDHGFFNKTHAIEDKFLLPKEAYHPDQNENNYSTLLYEISSDKITQDKILAKISLSHENNIIKALKNAQKDDTPENRMKYIKQKFKETISFPSNTPEEQKDNIIHLFLTEAAKEDTVYFFLMQNVFTLKNRIRISFDNIGGGGDASEFKHPSGARVRLDTRYLQNPEYFLRSAILHEFIHVYDMGLHDVCFGRYHYPGLNEVNNPKIDKELQKIHELAKSSISLDYKLKEKLGITSILNRIISSFSYGHGDGYGTEANKQYRRSNDYANVEVPTTSVEIIKALSAIIDKVDYFGDENNEGIRQIKKLYVEFDLAFRRAEAFVLIENLKKQQNPGETIIQKAYALVENKSNNGANLHEFYQLLRDQYRHDLDKLGPPACYRTEGQEKAHEARINKIKQECGIDHTAYKNLSNPYQNLYHSGADSYPTETLSHKPGANRYPTGTFPYQSDANNRQNKLRRIGYGQTKGESMKTQKYFSPVKL